MHYGVTGSTALSTYHIVNHIVVNSGSLVSALIGGGVVLLGVFVTEALTRVRERRRRLDEAAWDLQSALRGGLLTGRIVGKTTVEAAASYADVMHQLGRIRREAKWPIRNAKEIVAEVDAIVVRFMVAVVRYGTQKDGLPRLGPILGSKLLPLVLRESSSSQSLDEALEREGLPSLAEVTADESHNVAQPANKRS
jgi:hypothetical protein